MMSLKSEPGSAETAARILSQGKIAVLPTDTIYGFSALAILDGKKSGLDQKIDGIKKSAASKPLIELLAEPQDVFKYTKQEIPKGVFNKWPGPLTVILENNDWYKALTGRERTAFRCPGDEWLRRVVGLCGAPVYSTSVNVSGQEPLKTMDKIAAAFASSCELFVRDEGEGGAARSSAIVSLEGGSVRVIRPGPLVLSDARP